MPKDVFNRDSLAFGGAFVADKGLIGTPGNAGGAGLANFGVLMQNLQVQYAQQVNRIYEIGRINADARVYYIGGRPQGSMSVAHVIGPALNVLEYYQQFADVCRAENNVVSLVLEKAACHLPNNQAGGMSITAKYCTLMQIGISAQAESLMLSENSNIQFASLEMAARRGAAAA